jgi:hypothetical protein
MGDKRPEDKRQDAQTISMAADFSAPSPDAWTGLLDRILGEGEGVDALASRTLDGIEIQAGRWRRVGMSDRGMRCPTVAFAMRRFFRIWNRASRRSCCH